MGGIDRKQSRLLFRNLFYRLAVLYTVVSMKYAKRKKNILKYNDGFFQIPTRLLSSSAMKKTFRSNLSMWGIIFCAQPKDSDPLDAAFLTSLISCTSWMMKCVGAVGDPAPNLWWPPPPPNMLLLNLLWWPPSSRRWRENSSGLS